MAYTTPIHMVMYSMTSGVSDGSSSSDAVRCRTKVTAITTAHAASIARVRTSHSGKRCLLEVRQRGRSAATAMTAGAVMSRT
ncbi:hypothetical protein RKD18_006898 [Streptomyces phaeoluteigriseus]